MSLISFNRVQFEVDNRNILNHVNFTVEEGDFLSIVGPSGSGKSTLLKLVSGLISPTKGEILFNGKDIAKQDPIETRKQLSYCFQTPYLFGSTVKDNLAFPFDIRHEEFNQSRVDQLFTLFQMDKTYLNQDVKKLSGGEKQRIALIRQLLF